MKDARDVRLTMRDVILKRKGSGLKVLRSKQRVFDAGLSIPIAGKDMDFKRGYQWVDVRKRGAGKFRFINSHFEAFSSDIAYAQAQEVVRGPGSAKSTTIFVCDCNSDPRHGIVKTDIGDTQPHWAPYWLHHRDRTVPRHLAADQGAAGGLDLRSQRAGERRLDAAGFDHRIDMVFARTGDGGRLKALSGAITGDELGRPRPDHRPVALRPRRSGDEAAPTLSRS